MTSVAGIAEGVPAVMRTVMHGHVIGETDPHDQSEADEEGESGGDQPFGPGQ